MYAVGAPIARGGAPLLPTSCETGGGSLRPAGFAPVSMSDEGWRWPLRSASAS